MRSNFGLDSKFDKPSSRKRPLQCGVTGASMDKLCFWLPSPNFHVSEIAMWLFVARLREASTESYFSSAEQLSPNPTLNIPTFLYEETASFVGLA
eukprot:3103342-Amphidinium_carterae.1